MDEQMRNVNLAVDEIKDLMDWLSPEHDGRDFESECPSCTAYAKLSAALSQPAAQGDSRADMAKELANMHHDLLVVMQAAWIEWQRGAGANSAMQWIHNTLMGPGLIPDDDEPYASEPQAYFDKNKAEPFPECFCGRPSNQLWMGNGFCSNAHYNQHRASSKGGAA